MFAEETAAPPPPSLETTALGPGSNVQNSELAGKACCRWFVIGPPILNSVHLSPDSAYASYSGTIWSRASSKADNCFL